MKQNSVWSFRIDGFVQLLLTFTVDMNSETMKAYFHIFWEETIYSETMKVNFSIFL